CKKNEGMMAPQSLRRTYENTITEHQIALQASYIPSDEVPFKLSGPQQQTLSQRIEAYIAAPNATLTWEEVQNKLQANACAVL
ncbi:MAG: hypothetical protein AAFQ08_02540, partial [Bacteroidota bacterium]